MVGERPEKEIGMHAVRGGSIIGDHTISFTNDMEQISFAHRALDRDVFAHGAVEAASWIAKKNNEKYDGKSAQFFDMKSVLDLQF